MDPCVQEYGKFHMYCVSHPNTIIKAWGHPAPKDPVDDVQAFTKGYGKHYVQESLISLGVKKVDFVLIDGRYRVACALHVLLFLNKDAKIAIHDYMNRKYYHVIETYYDRIENMTSAAIFVQKKDISIPKDVLNKYLADKR